MSAKAERKASRRGLGFERLLLASLVALLVGCAGKAQATDPANVPLSADEQQLVAAWKAERGLSEGDALSNVMLRRYSAKGHKVRYAGEGLYEVLDREKGAAVVATFFVKGATK